MSSGAFTNSSQAILLLHGLKSSEAAIDACTALHESIINPGMNIPSEILTQLLQQTSSNSPGYWIAATSQECRAINVHGDIIKVDCNTDLAALCTQSTPFSNITYTDTSSN